MSLQTPPRRTLGGAIKKPGMSSGIVSYKQFIESNNVFKGSEESRLFAYYIASMREKSDRDSTSTRTQDLSMMELLQEKKMIDRAFKQARESIEDNCVNSKGRGYRSNMIYIRY